MTVSADIKYVGVNDHDIDLFEGQYVVPNGMAYNSYVIVDEKIAVMDTVDKHFTQEWLGNVAKVLGSRKPDYLIVQHMECDHSGSIMAFLNTYPDVTVVASAKAFTMLHNFHEEKEIPEDKKLEIKEGDTLNLGKHELAFVAAPMVHWPEVMVTYDQHAKILFSADAFGTFGALNGNIFADHVAFDRYEISEMRRYYANIVGKYGTQTQTLLNKALGLEIEMICPLHGPVWRVPKKIEWLIGKYAKWATYKPEDHDVVIFYSSVYGGTENACEVLANALGELKVRGIKMYDVSVTDVSYLVAEAFRASHLVFAATTYNNALFPAMAHFIDDLKEHNFQNRTVAVMENGSWAPVSGKKMVEYLSAMKNITFLGQTISMKSTVKEDQRTQILALAEEIAASVEEADRR